MNPPQAQPPVPVEAATEEIVAQGLGEPPPVQIANETPAALPINPVNGFQGDEEIVPLAAAKVFVERLSRESEGERWLQEAALLDYLQEPAEWAVSRAPSQESNETNVPVLTWPSGAMICTLSLGLLVSYQRHQSKQRTRECEGAIRRR